LIIEDPRHLFTPRRGITSGHAQTIFSWAWPRQFPSLPEPTVRLFDVAPETRVLAHVHWQTDRANRPLLLLLHGLNASSDAHYMRGMAAKAFARGMSVVRLNQRNCGSTEHLAPGLFHSGLTADAKHVIAELADTDNIRSVAVAGYSLGGNLALKLAGDYGDTPPPSLTAVAAVSPILEISQCVHALERRSNFAYQWNFTKALKARMRRKERHWPGRFDLSRLAEVHTVRDFDEVYTAPHFGFASAEDYYYRAAAMRVIDRVRIPALIVTAEDDPFVPAAPFRDPKVTSNPTVSVVITEHGGHCGFVGAPTPGSDGYWAEAQVVDFVTHGSMSI
jgi:predicted alpha/beta-fold hydrolase